MSTGQPMRSASASASSALASRSQPGTMGTPAPRAVRRAASLSPMRSMTSGEGPTKTRPHSLHSRAKCAFSEKNP